LVCPDTEEQPWWEDISPEQVREAVTRLPDELRCAFERFAFERKSYKEISAELGVPVATVGTRVLRARRRLRVLLEGAGRD
jgi:RNA polymerase sigma-70 factor (ECF subfamily)